MQIKCEYCENFMNDTDEKCPVCKADNPHYRPKVKSKNSHPKTIEELKKWYEDRNLPPKEVTRFFIGEDYKKPKAFGIYKDGDKFIVYKNKDTGARAIRYEGPDEAYAVNELYLKLKEEILNQKKLNNQRNYPNNNSKSKGKTDVKERKKGCLTDFIFFGGFLLVSVIASLCQIPIIGSLVLATVITGIALALLFIFTKDIFKRIGEKAVTITVYTLICAIIFVSTFSISYSFGNTRYYKVNDTVYCRYHWNYYEYDGFDYSPVSGGDLPDNLKDYYVGGYFWDGGEWADDFVGFKDSGYYDDNFSSSSSGNDSDYDWDSGDSWDSGGSDWGSDW